MGFVEYIISLITKGKSLLGGTSVTNISPRKEDFTPKNLEKNLKDIWLMLDDVRYLLWFKTALDDPGRKILSYYNKFKNIYKKEHKNIIELAKKSNKMEKYRKESEESFYGFCEMIESMKLKIDSTKIEIKNSTDGYRALKENTEKIKELNRKLELKKSEIADIEREWNTELERFKIQHRKKIIEEFNNELERAKNGFGDYLIEKYPGNKRENVVKRAKIFDQFLKGMYKWKFSFFGKSKGDKEVKEKCEFFQKYGIGNKNGAFINWLKKYHSVEHNLIYGKNRMISEAKLDFNVDGFDRLKELKGKYDCCAKEIKEIEKELESSCNVRKKLIENYNKLRKSEEEDKKMMDSIEKWDETISLYQKVYKDYYNRIVECMKVTTSIVGCCSVILAALGELKNRVIRDDDINSFNKASEYRDGYGSKISLIQVLGVSKCFVTFLEEEYKEKGEGYNAERKEAENEFEKIFRYKGKLTKIKPVES